MKNINTSEPEECNTEDAAIDPWDTGSPPAGSGKREFTGRERALLDIWDKANAPSVIDEARFEARLLAALDDKLEEPIGAHALIGHGMAELRDEVACAQMAADAGVEGAASADRPPPLIVVDRPAAQANLGGAPAGAIERLLERTYRWWRPDARGEPLPPGMRLPRSREPLPPRSGLCELPLDRAAAPPARVDGCVTPSPPIDPAAAWPASRKPLVVLMVAANPHRSSARRLSWQCAAIQRELDQAPRGDRFRFESRWAVNLRELTGHLAELAPTVLHIAGHGAVGDDSGLILEDGLGHERPVSGRALARMVGTRARSVRLAVLDACFRKRQADGLRRKVDCVVGIEGGIDDAAARTFACAFYAALGDHRSVGHAFEHSVAALAARQLAHDIQPHCLPRKGVDVRALGLWEPGPPVAEPRT